MPSDKDNKSRIVTPADLIRESERVVSLESRKIEKNIRKRSGQYERVLDALMRLDEELDRLDDLRRKLEWQKVQLRDQKRALERVITEETSKITQPGQGRLRGTLGSK